MIRTTVWQRLEPVTRTTEYDRALQAGIHDPLWLLGRQWQFGELEGEDAATPVHVRVEASSAPLSRVRLGDAGATVPYDPDAVPLEAVVEREAPGAPTLRLRAVAGRRLLGLLRAHGAPQTASHAAGAFPLPAAAPNDPDAATAGRLATVLRGRLPDGLAAAAALRSALPNLPPSLGAPHAEAAGALAGAHAFLDWIDADLLPPAVGSAWVRERLEYRFAVAAAPADGEVVLAAPEYRGAAVDWHDFDVDAAAGSTLGAPAAATSTVLDLVATPVSFAGMPADRFWQLEDATVSLPSVQAAPEDLGRLALVEFASAFGNDWFLVPLPVRFGTLTTLVSLVVTDTFGEPLLVRPTDTNGSRWRMFELGATGGDGSASTPRLFVPPVVAAATEGPLLEDVLFARDEQANLVWGVERIVEGPDGRGRDRNDEWLPVATTLDPPPLPSPAPLAYRLQSAVPAHWIPFVAVHDSSANRGVRLERAAMLRLDADPPAPVPPLGRILEPATAPYVLFEEEVPREGVRVRRIPALCRTLGGTTLVWTRRLRAVGRGEHSSGLRFDIARDTGDSET